MRFYVSLPASFLPPSSAGLQLQALDRRVPRQTPTATSGSKCSPPRLHRKLRIRVFPAGPPPQRTSEDIPDRMSERMTEDVPDTYARKIQKECQNIYIYIIHIIFHKYIQMMACQEICQNIVCKGGDHSKKTVFLREYL